MKNYLGKGNSDSEDIFELGNVKQEKEKEKTKNEQKIQNTYKNPTYDSFDKSERMSKAITICLAVLICIIILLLIIFQIKKIIAYRKFQREQKEIHRRSEGIQKAPGELDSDGKSGNLNPLGVDDPINGRNQDEEKDAKIRYKGHEVIGYIHIPKINIKYPILAKVTNKSLEDAVALEFSTRGLNEQGVSLIVGHNYKTEQFFGRLDKLLKNDIFYITDLKKNTVKYKIYDVKVLADTDKSFIYRNTDGKKEANLSTCTDDSLNRFVVFARAEE